MQNYGGSSYVGQNQSYGYNNSFNGGSDQQQGATLRRRQADDAASRSNQNQIMTPPRSGNVVKKLDFMFPKVDTEYTVQTDSGGLVSMIAYILIALMVLAESSSWISQNRSTVEHAKVDTSLGQRMRVNLNITFPSLACVDLHVDVMDVAGDSQLNIEDTFKKQALTRHGSPTGPGESVESNAHQIVEEGREEVLKTPLPENYCGPCFGAQKEENECCNSCDSLLKNYEAKGWNSDAVLRTSEQCIREGRDQQAIKKMTKGQGCNLSGYMILNRVAGNFHIAMGEGIERNGRHIHTFDPTDSENFNSSHVIHHLSFGPKVDISAGKGKFNSPEGLNGVEKFVTKEKGTTGLFQYFIKVVPTTVIGSIGGDKAGSLQTNRYFFTERFRPLMKEYHADLDHDDTTGKAQAGAGGAQRGHNKHDHHDVKNSILPGVFFIYEIYPFEVEVSPVSVPFTHLLIRLMAVTGGVLTVFRWVATALIDAGNSRQRGPRL